MQTFWSLFVHLLEKLCTFVAKKNTKCKYVKMKKIFVMVVAALMAIGSVQAQEEWKNEISIAYGGGSNTDIVSSLAKGMFTGKQLDYWGPVSVEYFYRPQENLGIGGIAAVSGCKWDDDSDAKSVYYTLMPAVKYNWLNKKSFSMYSKAAVGVTFMSDSGTKDSDSKVVFNWQASLIGMEFGGAFRGFVELGMGEQGIILGGLRYKF